MAAILIFKYTKGAGVGDYSSRGREAVPHPLSRFDAHLRSKVFDLDGFTEK